jgi:hypothetical protein
VTVARWKHSVGRLAHHRVWLDVPRAVRFGLRVKAQVVAERAGATLRSDEPVAGWRSNRLAKDGKYWPCGEGAAGAEPAWIWIGDT